MYPVRFERGLTTFECTHKQSHFWIVYSFSTTTKWQFVIFPPRITYKHTFLQTIPLTMNWNTHWISHREESSWRLNKSQIIFHHTKPPNLDWWWPIAQNQTVLAFLSNWILCILFLQFKCSLLSLFLLCRFLFLCLRLRIHFVIDIVQQ